MENSERKLDQLIKNYLEGKMANKERFLPHRDCPTELELVDYLEQRLSAQKNESLLKHLADCPHCLSLLELTQRANEQSKEGPSLQMISHAKNLVGKSSKKPTANYKWPILGGITFLLSFIFPRYFLQFLILAVIFSLKWIFDTASTRTLIMIYEAWRKKDPHTLQRIMRDSWDRTEMRK